MHFLLHLLSHAVLKTHEKNMEHLRQRLHAHRVAHDAEQAAHKRSVLLHEQLQQAMKVQLFRHDLLKSVHGVQEQKTREHVENLTNKLRQIELEERQLADDLRKKTALHELLSQRIAHLEKEVEDVLSSVKKAKR